MKLFKHLTILLLVCISLNAFSIGIGNDAGHSFALSSLYANSDSGYKVSYITKSSAIEKSKPAYFLNGQMIDESVLKTLDPNIISDINVASGTFEYENNSFSGKIQIYTKEDYAPKLITLRDMKMRYISIASAVTVFEIDNEVVNSDYDRFWIDQNYLLEIIIEKIENLKENLALHIVKIYTKSAENVRKQKEGKPLNAPDPSINN
jgi:hypothetical protein